MTEREKVQAQQEAKSSAARGPGSSGSSERARLWAGMNRYLAAEVAHAGRADDASAEKAEETAQETALGKARDTSE